MAVIGVVMVVPVLPDFEGFGFFVEATFTAFRNSLNCRIRSTAITAIRLAAWFFTGITAQSLTFGNAELLSIQ
jgi:hypothetical protein